MKFRSKVLLVAGAALAVVGVGSVMAVNTVGGRVASFTEVGDVALASAPPTMVQPTPNTAPGGSETGERPSGEQADKATQLIMKITNSTSETLKYTSATSSGKGNHWQDRPSDMAPGATQLVSNYAAGDAELAVTYTGEQTGAVFNLHGETPLIGHNSASGTSSSTSYTVDTNAASGYKPTDTYFIRPGYTFTYTGANATYTVPPGVNSLKVTAVGGASLGGSGDTFANGAQINGTMTVTPGETLTVGVAGNAGPAADKKYAGGWGMTVGNDDYSGGDSAFGVVGGISPEPGGGATVILNGSNNIAVVAGGAGGGGYDDYGAFSRGGRAGYNGSWTGENAPPNPGGGGQAGGNTTTQGQSSGGGADAGGAGGGGVNGGAAGTAGTGKGGGAGSSAAAGLQGASIETAPTTSTLR